MGYPNAAPAAPRRKTVVIALAPSAGVCLPESAAATVREVADETIIEVQTSSLAVVEGALYLELGPDALPAFLAPGQWASAAVKGASS